MKWTAEGKKIGDKVAYRPYRGDPHIEVEEITGETRTQWLVGSRELRIRKSDGLIHGTGNRRAFDVDDDVSKQLEERRIAEERRAKHLAIHRWVEKSRQSTVVDLLWPIVGPLIEGVKA